MNLRFIIREGKRILQYCEVRPIEEWKSDPNGGPIQFKVLKGHTYTWHDIPLCDEVTGEEIENEV